MARICEICGKKPLVGYSVSHSHRKTKRRQLPNLQKKKILISGQYKKIRICTKCLKNLEKISVKEKLSLPKGGSAPGGKV